MIIPLSTYKNIYKGKDVYIVGSGASMDYIDKSFFDNKIVVGCNNVYRHWRCDFVVSMHLRCAQGVIDAGLKLIVAKYDRTIGNVPINLKGDYTNYKLPPKMSSDYEPVIEYLDKDDTLLMGVSTIIPAISFAYYLGAKSIVLCGCDCCYIDNESNYFGYYHWIPGWETRKHAVDKAIALFFKNSPKQRMRLRDALKKRGVNVYSLNPFINLLMENHIIEKEGQMIKEKLIEELKEFQGNTCNEKEKNIRANKLTISTLANSSQDEFRDYLIELSKYCIVPVECEGYSKKRMPINFRSMISIEDTITKIIRPFEEQFHNDIQIFTENNRLRYCIWLHRDAWESEIKYLIELVRGIK